MARKKSPVEWISLAVLYGPFTWIYRARTPRERRRGEREGNKKKEERRVLRSIRSEIRYSAVNVRLLMCTPESYQSEEGRGRALVAIAILP